MTSGTGQINGSYGYERSGEYNGKPLYTCNQTSLQLRCTAVRDPDPLNVVNRVVGMPLRIQRPAAPPVLVVDPLARPLQQGYRIQRPDAGPPVLAVDLEHPNTSIWRERGQRVTRFIARCAHYSLTIMTALFTHYALTMHPLYIFCV